MVIKTSYFAKSGKLENAVSIAVGTPKFFAGPSFKPLMPPWPLVNGYKNGSISEAEYEEEYKKTVLEKLDAAIIGRELDGKTLLCWEKSGVFCHRHIVASWLRERGYEVEEA